MRFVAFGTYDVRSHPRVGVLIQGLRDAGHDVVELNRPLGLDTAQRIALVQQPWRLPLLALRLLRCWATLAALGVRERRRRPDAVLVGYLGHFDVHLARLLFRGTPIVLDHLVSAAGTTADRGLSDGGLKDGLMRGIDRAALGAADVVVVDTEVRRTALPPEVAGRTVVCPVGATDAWFAAGAARGRRRSDAPLKVVFVGLYTPLHGTRVIAEALAALADDERIQVTMVGRGQDRADAERIAAPNDHVAWVDWVTSEDLPGLVAGQDVSLGIFGTTRKALEVVPTKVYQGAAAATVVVTSDTSPQRHALEDVALLVPPGDPAALAQALRRLAGDPALVETMRTAAHARASTSYTAEAVTAPILDALANRRTTTHR